MEDNNYLWDRSGEPDPEIKALEEALGTLRYQPRPLQLPANLQVGRRRKVFPGLAIAAAIILFAIAMTIWFSINRQTQTPAKQAATSPQTTPPEVTNPERPLVVTNEPEEKSRPSRNVIANNRTRRIRAVSQAPALTPQELADKEQVLIALRLVSAKLNIAQRRAQGAPPPTVLRNHRIG